MDDTFRNGIALVCAERYRFVFQVNEQRTFENEEELVFSIMLVPMKVALENAQPNDAIVHLAKGLVVPFLAASGHEARHVDQLERTKLRIEMNVVWFCGSG